MCDRTDEQINKHTKKQEAVEVIGSSFYSWTWTNNGIFTYETWTLHY